MTDLREHIREAALSLGFARVGFTTAGPIPRAGFMRQWVDHGYAGSMGYLARTLDLRGEPAKLLPEARTVIVGAASYASAETDQPSATAGVIARYARGKDYHAVLGARLHRLAALIEEQAGGPASCRVAVDTAPLLERELGMAAGVGFIGKNTLLISPGIGSTTVLGLLLTTLEIPPDPPSRARCGRCRLCLDACPTGALLEPHLLDARRCIAYLTIEHRGPIDPWLREKVSPWIFGCDICQVVCPYNARSAARPTPDPDLAPPNSLASLDLLDLIDLRSGAYRRLVRGRALQRVPRPGLIRNALLAAAPLLGAGDLALHRAVESSARSTDATVRDAACWALAR